MKAPFPESVHPAGVFPRANRLAGLFEPATVVLFAGLGGACVGIERAYVRGGFKDKYVDVSVNHWDTAVGVHELNHPLTHHLRADVWEVDPDSVLPARKIGLLHLSPDCTDFSKAKGGKPKRKHIRALADVGLVWAAKRRPDVITLENVEEFLQWGPVIHKQDSKGFLWLKTTPVRKGKPKKVQLHGPHEASEGVAEWVEKHEGNGKLEPLGYPDPERRGTEFLRWKRYLESLGYVVDHRELRACNLGVPTTRKRLFVIARCDGKEIIWPETTHGNIKERASGLVQEAGDRVHRAGRRKPSLRVDGVGPVEASGDGKACRDRTGHDAVDVRNAENAGENAALHRGLQLKPFHTAAECIDWDLPMLSIFATRKEAREWAERINKGRPKHERVGVPQRPLRPKTQKRIAGGLDKWVLKAKEPFLVNIANYGWDSSPNRPVSEPLDTVTAGPRGGIHAVVDVELSPGGATEPSTTAFTGTFNHGGDEHRTADLRQPLSTVTGANDARGVVGVEATPFIARCAHGDQSGDGSKRWGNADHSLQEPLPTVAASRDFAVVAPTLSAATDSSADELIAVAINKHFGGVIGQPADVPLGTVTGIDHHSVLAASLTSYHGPKGEESRGQSPDEPLRTLDTQNRFGVVGADVVPFTCGAGGSGYAGKPRSVDAPMNTVLTNDRQVVVTAHVIKFRGDSAGSPITDPLPTVTSGAGAQRDAGAVHAMGMAACYLSHMYTSNTCGGQGDPNKPLKTITSGGRHAKVCVVYMTPYYGSSKDCNTPAAPCPTVVGRDRFGLVALETTPHWVFPPQVFGRVREVGRWAKKMLGDKVKDNLMWVEDHETGEKFPLLFVRIKGVIQLITDIAMRMLRPRELARAQGFPDWYVIDRTSDGKPISKADQVKLIGNSVPPAFTEAITWCNVVQQGVLECAGEAVPA